MNEAIELTYFLWGFETGPGCSSVGAGAFVEHGPFRPSEDVLVQNEYSWNKGSLNLFNIETANFCVNMLPEVITVNY